MNIGLSGPFLACCLNSQSLNEAVAQCEPAIGNDFIHVQNCQCNSLCMLLIEVTSILSVLLRLGCSEVIT